MCAPGHFDNYLWPGNEASSIEKRHFFEDLMAISENYLRQVTYDILAFCRN